MRVTSYELRNETERIRPRSGHFFDPQPATRNPQQVLSVPTRNPQPATRNHSSAFTLIEVLVVLTLMSLIMGLGAVYFAGNLASSRITKSVREISGTVRYGRVLAAETGEVQSIIFDLDSRSYGIEGRTTKNIPTGIAIRITDRLAGERSHGKHTVHLLPSGAVQGGTIVLEKGQSTVSIHPDPIVGVTVVKQ